MIAVAALIGTAGAANAWPHNGPYSNQSSYPKYNTVANYVHGTYGHKQPQPTFQAAPWYLYWPYDGHFMTPAPVGGQFNGPPTPGNFPVNPYFQGQMGGGFGPGGYPGGPVPR